MDDAFPVRGRQRRADLRDDRLHLLERQRPALQARRQRLALQQLEHDVRRAVRQRVEVQHLDDVRVAEARPDLRLAPEARQHRRVGGAEQQHLDHDALAGQPQVLRLPHRAHPALSEQARDLVRLGDDDAGPQAHRRRARAGARRRRAGSCRRLAPGRHRPVAPVDRLRRYGRILGRIQRAGRHVEAAIIDSFRSRSTAALRRRGSPTVTIDLQRPPSVGAFCCTEDWRAQTRRLARSGAQARLGPVLRVREGRLPGGPERAALAAARRVGRLGRALSHQLPRVRRRPAREGGVGRRGARGGRPRRGLPAARRGLARGPEAARRDAAARRVRGGGRQPARGALRSRQRVAIGGAARRARRDAPHADPAPAHARSRALGSAVRLDAQVLPHQQLGRDRRAPPRRRAAARRPTRSSSRSRPTSCSRPASPTCSSSGSRRSRTASATRCSRRWWAASRATRRATRRSARPCSRPSSKHDRAYAQYLLDKWFWRSWLLFAVVTGFAMDYLTPLEHRTQLVQGVHARVGARSVPALARRVRPRAPVVLGHLPRGPRQLSPHGLRERVHLPRVGLVRLRRARARRSAPGCARSIRASWPDFDPIWERITDRWRAADPGNDFAVHGTAIVVVLRSLPARAVGRHAARQHRQRSGSRRAPLHLLLEPCRWIFEQEPERYAGHKDVVKRVLAGEAPANLVALVQRYFGLDYDTWGKDAFGGDYPWLARPARSEGGPHDPALRLSRRRHDRAPRAGARPTTRSPSSRASCRRRRGCAPRSTGRSR